MHASSDYKLLHEARPVGVPCASCLACAVLLSSLQLRQTVGLQAIIQCGWSLVLMHQQVNLTLRLYVSIGAHSPLDAAS